MPTLSRTADTWWQAVRATGRRRAVAECCFALVFALITGVSVAEYGVLKGTAQIVGSLAAALAALVLIPLRLVRPVTAMVLGALAGIPAGSASLLIVVLSWSTGYRAKKPVPIVLGYLITAVSFWIGVSLQPDAGGLTGVLLAITLFALFGVLPGAIAAMIAQRRLLVMTMHQRNLELHQERLLVAAQAQVRERNRIAAELHDSLGHRLTLISLYAGGLARTAPTSPPPEPVPVSAPSTDVAVSEAHDASGGSGDLETAQRQEALALLRDVSAQAMGELRLILKVLHQDEAVDSGRSLQEVDATVAAARQTGTTIDLVRVGEPRPLGLIGEHAAFRVVQEGLTNALKHAAGAPVRVELRYDSDALFVEVRNEPGRPSWVQSSGQGLLGLTERVRLTGGVLSSGPMTDGGFRLSAIVPYDSQVPEPAREADAGDFPQVMRRSSRRQRIGLVAVIVALLVSLSSCVAAIATIADDAPDPVGENVFNSTRIGDDEQRLDDLLPDKPIEVTHGPAGQRCERYARDLPSEDQDTEVSFRFCFRDGKVVSKSKVRMKGNP